MSMSIADMRYALYQVPKYKGAYGWIQRVNKMHEDQVLAVYLRFQRKGLLKK